MILFTLMAIPLLAATFSVIFKRSHYGSAITLTGALSTFFLAIQAAQYVISSPTHILTAIPDWLELHALGAIILCLVALIYVTAAIFSVGYMKFNKKNDALQYYANFNLFVFSMLIIPMIQEPNITWIAVELTTLFSVLLVGFANTHDALEAAWKYVILTLMGAAMALLGFLILYWAAKQAGIEHYTWTGLITIAPKMSPILLKTAFVLILIGFGAKIGLVPLHTWLPDAHSQAPTPVCALLSGIETSVVLYVILRLLPVIYALPSINAHTWLTTFGLLSTGTAAFLLLHVSDYKRLFAFSTVEHMGIILTAAGLKGVASHYGAILQIINHAVTKSFCFYAAGSVLLLMKTSKITSVRGLIHRTPAAGAALLLGGLAIAGAPPFALFLSEFSILRAGIQQGDYLVSGLLLLFIAIAFFAIMGHISRMVFGTDGPEEPDQAEALPLSCKITLVTAALPVIILGLYTPGALQKLITLAAAAMGGGMP